jgi:isoleucyl-tRNA synthetase
LLPSGSRHRIRHWTPIAIPLLQDIVTRYASSTGHHVSRRFGWDCHGLPVEYEIDKKLSELPS